MRDLNISKELIKKVLVEEAKNLSEDFSFYIYEDYITFSNDGEQLFDYSIYKFAFKCKEWAYKQKIGKTGTYSNGCGWSQQHLMYDINIVTKQCDKEYLATIDNGKDLNCSLDFYGLSAMHNSSVVQFNYKANTVKDICFYANTEPEVIFKACNWVLENIK